MVSAWLIASCLALIACDRGADSRATRPSSAVAPVSPVGDAAVTTPAKPAAAPVERSSEAACKANGGLWSIFGFASGCALPAVDSGQACRGRAECQGECVTDASVPAGTAVIGKCYPWQHVPDTAVNRVVNGRAEGTVILN